MKYFLTVAMHFVVINLMVLASAGSASAACTAGAYCSRSGQNNSVANRKTPLPADQVPEAGSGFQDPLGNVRYLTNTSGNGFGQYDGLSYPNCGPVYHPGLDLNWGSRNQDCNSAIGSVADGVVVWIGGNTDWMGIMVQHKYRGEMIIAGYGHVMAIDPNLKVGSKVVKGQYLARVGSVGAVSCHLHFEIRKLSAHPNPMKGNFFCDYDRYSQSIRDYQTVSAWYYDPEPFIDSHPAYTLYVEPAVYLTAPNSVYRNGVNNYDFTVGIREYGGGAMNIDWVYFDGQWYQGPAFFGTSKLKAYGSLQKSVHVDRFLWQDQWIQYTVWRWNSRKGAWDSWSHPVLLHRSW
jgi:murein DD-endopeptidase MepM/ murein hydrolase activator NlpD